MKDISFPGLGIGPFNLDRVAFHIFSVPVYWYGLLIAAGMLLAFLYAVRRREQFGVTFDDLSDITLWGIIFGIIGARLFYVLFYYDSTTESNPYFSDPVSMLHIWEGGLAIYGGLIGAFATVLVFCKIKKQNPMNYLDIASLGFLIGQGIGRWGNFFNQEAYGSPTSLPWRMHLYDLGLSKYVSVHPCFLYESLWCLLGFLFLHFYSKNHKKFAGQIFLLYAAWYSFGRFFIEGLRSDSLMLGSVKVSQLLSGLVFIAAVTTLIVLHIKFSEKENEQLEYNPVYSDIEKEIAEEQNELDSDFQSDEKSEAEGAGDDDELEGSDASGDGGDAEDDPDDEQKTAEESEDAGENH